MLARIAGDITDVAGYGIARKSSAEVLDQFHSFLFGDFEMGGAGHAIKLMQVVGHDSQFDEALKQVGQDVGAIIHSVKQNTLAEQRNACINKPGDRSSYRSVNLCRMVHMKHHQYGQPGLGRPSKQIVGYPLWYDDGHAGVEAEPTNVFDLGDSVGQVGKTRVFDDEWVASAEDDFMGGRVVGEMAEGVLEAVDVSRRSGGRVVAAEAESAMDCASVSCYDEGSASVLGEQAGSRCGVGLAERVADESFHNLRFGLDRQHLAQQWIVRIAWADSLEEGPRYQQAERFGARSGFLRDGGRQVQQAAEFARIGDGLGENRLPVIGRRLRARINLV